MGLNRHALDDGSFFFFFTERTLNSNTDTKLDLFIQNLLQTKQAFWKAWLYLDLFFKVLGSTHQTLDL